MQIGQELALASLEDEVARLRGGDAGRIGQFDCGRLTEVRIPKEYRRDGHSDQDRFGDEAQPENGVDTTVCWAMC